MLQVSGAIGDFDDPDPELMSLFRRWLVDEAAEFWARNHGDVSFHYRSGDEWMYLILNFEYGRGYHVLHKGRGDRVDWKLMKLDADDSPVTIYFGGEPEVVPANAFVSPQTAWDIVEQYCVSGARPPAPTGMIWRQELDVRRNRG